jgi:hypothetical protein
MPGGILKEETQCEGTQEWEQYFDDEIGVTLRLWFYYASRAAFGSPGVKLGIGYFVSR